MKQHVLIPLMKSYLNQKELTPDARNGYHTILKQYITYLSDHHIKYATTEDVLSYLDYKKSLKISPKWMHHQISVIKGFNKYLSTLKDPKYHINITAYIKNVKPKAIKPHMFMPLNDLKALLKCMKVQRRDLITYRDYALILLMATTGIRSIEVRRARRKDLTCIGHREVLYIQGKGRLSKDAFVNISKKVSQALHEYLQKRGDHKPYLFISHKRGGNNPNVSRAFIYSLLQRNIKECNLQIKHVHPHMLRSTAAHIHLKAGGTLEETQTLLRHQDVETTLIYTKNMHSTHQDLSTMIESHIIKGKKHETT